MKTMLMAVAVTFSAPSFAGEKKEEKKGGHADTFGEKKDKGGK